MRISWFILLNLIFGLIIYADGPKKAPALPLAPADQLDDAYTVMSINQWHYWARKDGLMGRNPVTGQAGGFYPSGDDLAIQGVYSEGLMWGGFVRDGSSQELRVGGATYSIGTVPGWIVTPGDGVNPPIAVDRNDPRARIYRIRPDFATLTTDNSEVIRDAAILNNIEIGQVTEMMAQEVIDQYARDWQEWPIDLGAPFYDVNGNGSYDPGLWIDGNNNGNRDRGEVEAPGLQLADQVIFFIMNDTDEAATTGLYGSLPIGFEVQVTLWGYARGAARQHALFKRYRIFNYSGFRIDSMYVAQWVDGDLGNFSDDLLACDTTLDAGFQYNGRPVDTEFQQYGLPPGAIAFALMQGPAVPSAGDTALVDFQPVPDFKNLGMTSFWAKYTGSPIGDPCLRDYDCTLQFYNLFRGFWPTQDLENPTPYIAGDGPNAGLPTKFPLSGDPVTRIGDLDNRGANLPPGDRRMALPSGPFTMENGDVQEVVFAVVGGLDPTGDEITSFAEARQHVKLLRQGFAENRPAPEVIPTVEYLDGRSTRLSVKVLPAGQEPASGITFRAFDAIGNEPVINLILFDDGAHGDGAAGDGLWGNSIEVDNRRFPHTVDLTVVAAGISGDYRGIIEQLRLRPLPELSNWQVIWENAIQDRQLNNSERAHLTFTIRNRDQVNPIDNARFTNLTNSIQFNGSTGNQVLEYVDHINPGETVGSGNQYWILQGPANADSLFLKYRMNIDGHSLIASDTLPLRLWMPGELWNDTLAVIAERGVGENLLATVRDPSLLTGHTYQIEFSEFVGGNNDTTLTWLLSDSTIGTVLLSDQPINNDPEFNHPVVDGIMYKLISPLQNPFALRNGGFIDFSVVANGAGPLSPPEGAAADFQGFPSLRPTDRQQIGEGRWMIHTGDNGSRGSIHAFVDRITRSGDKISLITPFDYEIRFTAGGSVAIDWFQYGAVQQVPFELWNIGIRTQDDPSDDYRMVPVVIDFDLDGEFDFIDGADHTLSSASNDPFTDWVYWYNPIDRSPGEGGYLAEAQQLLNNPSSWERSYFREVMARMVLVNWNGGETTTNGPYNQDMPEEGTIFRITTVKANLPGDVLRVRAPQSVPNEFPPPLSFELFQNFPNPFNPTTVIRYSLSVDRPVKLEIYDVLGRRVKTLVDEPKKSGTYRITWDGRADGGYPVSAGLYFYRLTASDFVKTRKMILLR